MTGEVTVAGVEPVPDDGVFCVLPWVHLNASVDGVWGRCCVDSAMYHDHLYEQAEEPAFTLHPDALGCVPRSRFAPDNPGRVFDIESAFNSPGLRDTRTAMLAGRRVAACEYCYAREEGGGESYRQKMNAWFAGRVDVPAIVAGTTPDGSLPGFPVFLDIRFGNSCNLRCIMCGYPVSSRWGLDKHPVWAPAHVDPYRDDEQLWAALRRHATELRRVYFAGGEPFMQPGHFRLLDLLVETGAAADIDVVYNSNLTLLPDGIFAKLARFHSAGIGASCDGTGEVFERIRVGARWDTFVNHVRTARQHVTVWLQVAPQRDNVLHLREIVDFAAAEGVGVDLTNFVHWPAELSVRNLPVHRREEAAAYLTGLAADCRARHLPEVAGQVDMLLDFVRSGES
jgi:pyruvate-formate lyase-activating enzyme